MGINPTKSKNTYNKNNVERIIIMKKNNTTTTTITTNGVIKETFEKYPNISLRKLSEYTNVNYNMLLKSSKKPIVGVPYEPTQVNYEEVERYLRSKNVDVDNLNYEEIESVSSIRKLKEDVNFEVGDKFKIRNDDNIYMVVCKTSTHISFVEYEGTIIRVMNNNTFEHQTPKKVD